MRLIYSVLAIACVFIASCNTVPVKPEPLLGLSSAQLQEIQSYDELVGMRQSLATKLVGKEPVDYGEDFAALAQIDAQIVALKKSELATLFASKRLDNGVVPLPILSALESGVINSAQIPEGKWQAVVDAVQVETTKTQSLLAELKVKAGVESDPSMQVGLYEQLYQVSGDSAWQAKSDALVEALVAEVRSAAESESFDDETRKKIELIKGIRPQDGALVDEMIGVDAKIYAKRFFDFLGEGNADNAYKTLVRMSGASDFLAIKDKLTPTSQKMADYFTALAVDSVKSPENLSQSYRWYSQAREVRAILGLSPAAVNDFSALADQLHARFAALDKASEPAAGLAYLYAIKSFVPNRPALRKELRAQEAKVRDIAVKRLSTTDFRSSYKDQDYGDVISSFVTQYLFEHVPYDVRIVERSEFESIERERSIGGETTALSSVNLLVSGSVLESKVDSNEARNKKMLRVEVGNETIPNPNYIGWLKLSARDRKDIAQPSETIDVPRHENISVGVTRHRKVGIFSVSYRLVEAVTGRVIFPDSITVSSEYEDESSEGVEMGDFVIPFKLADLPSDVRILDTLAKQVATQIGKRLVEELKDQELKYLAEAEDFNTQNDCVGESAALGNALLIMALKSQDSTSVLARYRDSAVACFN